MNKSKWVLMAVSLAMIAGTAFLLAQLKTYQRLGAPGVKTEPIPGSNRLSVVLPEKVLDYDSESVETDEITLKTLPQDTSFGQRRYAAPDGFVMAMSVVLMGVDRTSLHKPQFCLQGAGLQIDQRGSLETSVAVDRPVRYDLPVVKLLASKVNDKNETLRAVYVYWFVADNAMSASISGYERMWWLARTFLTTGVLQRWAYVSCLTYCAPGQEEATFARMKKFIAASVPEFQLTPRAPQATAALR
jgi:hypothetical protein